MDPIITKSQVRKLWLNAQGLSAKTPFGSGHVATTKAIEHLGYVQIDTISVIERCHHHILYSRIPDYKKSYLHQAQTVNKSVFEYWTHALAYIPTKDYAYFIPAMKTRRQNKHKYFSSVKSEDIRKVLRLIKKEGPISIRDIDDDVLVEKAYLWDSRKPSKKVLQWGFNIGDLVISEREGMLKKYELTLRHFDWKKKPKAATPLQVLDYIIDRALRSQAVVSLDSICYLAPRLKPAVLKRLDGRTRKKALVQVQVRGIEKEKFWMAPDNLQSIPIASEELVHILSPFDPLIIQRKRLKNFFEYQHLFEAYIPKEKRVYGYFALPVIVGENVVALLDIKTDRVAQQLLIQKWTWLPKMKSPSNKKLIENELHRFEDFQLG